MNKSPCLKCPDRYVGCHSKCERYIAFRTEQDRILKNMYDDNRKFFAVIDVLGKKKR